MKTSIQVLLLMIITVISFELAAQSTTKAIASVMPATTIDQQEDEPGDYSQSLPARPRFIQPLSTSTMSMTVSGDTATNITFYGALLQASADPEGLSTSVRFEFGTDTTYGYTLIPVPDTITGNGPVSFQVDVTGIAAGTTYHFRVKTENYLGVFFGDDRVFSTPAAPANNFTFTPARMTNQILTWNDLGANGTAISFDNYDDAHSMPVNIGFNFGFCGVTFSQFVINTNGFIKLGNIHPADSVQFFESPRGISPAAGLMNGILKSQHFADVYLISPFNHDLQPGTSTPEIRVLTEGVPGNRVCTIQFKNFQDKIEPPDRQYNNMQFQIKLHENNVVEFVWGTWEPSSNVSAWRAASVGLKGSTAETNQILSITKSSNASWQIITTRIGNYCNTCNAFNFGNPTRPQPEPGRTYTFYPKVAHDATIQAIYTLGKLPIPSGLPHTVKAYIKNSGLNPLTNLPVSLNITGSNLFSGIDTISLLMPDSGAVIEFPGFNPAVLGYNTVNVSGPADDYPFDNAKNFAQEVTINEISYCDSTGIETVLGFGAGGSAYPAMYLNKYHINRVKNIRAANIGLGNGTGQNVYAVVLNAAREIKAQSAMYPLTAANSNKYHLFEFPDPPVISDGDFYIGLAQTGSLIGYNPMGAQGEVPNRNNAFYVTVMDGSGLNNDFDGNTRFCIEAIMDSGYCQPNFTYSCNNPLYGQYIKSFWTTGGTTNIYNMNTDCPGNPNNYTFYPDQMVSAEQGTPFSFTGGVNFSGLQFFSVWIDWNQDGDFYDDQEHVYNSGFSYSGYFYGTIAVPMSALTGNTRMRVVLLHTHNTSMLPDPCGSYDAGETEEYVLNVLPAAPMTYLQGTTFQCDTGFIPSRGMANVPIIGMKMEVTGVLNPLTATSFNLNSLGSTNFAHDVSLARIYCTGHDSVFSSSHLFGSSANLDNPITGIDTLLHGTNYFWLAYDITDTATIGNFLDASCLNYTISGSGTHIPAVSSPQGRLTINYCIPGFGYPGGCDWGAGINSFSTSGGITNISNPDNGCPGNPYDYTFFSNQTVTAEQGAPFRFDLTSTGNDPQFFMYIDWNQDDDFDDPGELAYDGWMPASDMIVVPDNAVPGTTRLRIIAFWQELKGNTSTIYGPGCPWFDYGAGETEDYRITVLPGSPMTYQTGTAFQCDTLPPVSRGSSNNPIIGIKLNMSGWINPVAVNSFGLNPVGSSDFAHDVSHVKIFCTGQDSLFSTDQLFGSATGLNNPIAGMKTLSAGENFFWVTYNVRDTATMGNNLDASCPGYTIGTETYSPIITSPYGKQIIDYCIPFFPDTSVCSKGAAINNFSTTGGTANITNLNSGCPDNRHSYSKFTKQIVSAGQGSTFSFYYSCMGGTPSFYILADWNRDFDFNEGNETVYANTDESENELFGDIMIPDNALTGQTRLRLITNSMYGMKSPIIMGCGYTKDWGETEDYTIEVLPGLPIISTVQNVTIAGGHDTCFNALQTITVAGSGTTFIVQDGGSATMVAGQKISYLTGSKVNSGGYMHGYITNSNQFCGSMAAPIVAVVTGVEGFVLEPVQSLFRVYPNPTTGDFILEFSDDAGSGKTGVEIFNVRGERVIKSEISGRTVDKLSLSGQPVGIYLVRVVAGGKSETARIVKQ
jgi:hypothetical protein